MKKNKPINAFKKLVENQISREELEALLAEIEDEKIRCLYEVYLSDHFDEIMNEYLLKKEEEEKNKR